MRAALPEATIRRVASIPSTSGMRTSIRTTSGAQLLDEARRLAAVARLAHHLDVRLGFEDHPEAAADERLVVDQQDADVIAPAPAPAGSRARTR